MTSRAIVWSALVPVALMGAAQGCELIVNDGNYTVGSSAGASSGASSGTATTGSTSGTAASGTATAGSASGITSSGTSSGSSTSGGTSIAPDPACVTCEQQPDTAMGCGTEWAACQASPACVNFSNCEDNCGTHSCNCAQQFPAGESLWINLQHCRTSNCLPCPFIGIGDPCLNDIDCAGATSCASPANTPGWCTPSMCTTSADCAGVSLGGLNAFGQKNYCLLNTGNTNTCFPGCSTNADCQAFTGTDCESATTVDQPTLSIKICSLATAADGGAD